MDHQPDLRIALLGNSVSGKSASGNTILNQNRFRENYSLHDPPRPCESETAEEDGRNILVIDTPGLFETSMDEDKLIAEMKTCALQSFPGLHAFLLVIRLDVRLKDEETNIMKWVENVFGEHALRYTFILFTHADALYDGSLDEFIRGRSDLQRLINSCGGDRYHAFNNKNRRNRDQVTELIEKIDRMILNNGGHHNTLQEFEKREEREKREREERERREREERERREREERERRERGEREERERSRSYWEMAKVAGIAIVIGGLAKQAGGVVLVKKALFAAAVGIYLYRSTRERHQRHNY